LTKEQIERFLKAESSPEEATAIVQYFEEHPEKMEEFLGHDDWEMFQQEAVSSESLNFRAMWQRVGNQTINTPQKVFSIKRVLTIAASLLIVACVAWFLAAKKSNAPSQISSSVSNNKFIENTGADVMMLTLPDNSNIQLMPGSSISYIQPFGQNFREINLRGEAFFNVAKDSLHPFIVYAGGISTKVLGTQFLVTAFSKENTIRVALFSGKVFVEPADSLRDVLKENYHLNPGDIFLFDKIKMIVRITSGKTETAKKTLPSRSSRSANNLSDNNWYMFNNQSLSEVFEELEVLYNEKIFFSKNEVAGLSFIGKIDKSDSLETILAEIGKLNNLSVHKEKDVFYIKRK
jgi:transmembrane sensor